MANKIYTVGEASTTWTDTTGDLAMTLNGLLSGAGRQGAQLDLGIFTTARAGLFGWRAYIQFATAPVVGQNLGVYLKTSDGAHPDNDDGTGNIAVSAEDKLRNLMTLKPINVDEAAAGVKMVASGQVFIPADQRYVMPIFWNFTDDNLAASNNVSGFVLTPIPFEIQ